MLDVDELRTLCTDLSELLGEAESYVRDAQPPTCGACGTPMASCDTNCVEAVHVGDLLIRIYRARKRVALQERRG